ncbi:hypothetical protein [Xanthomonas sp. MUS 060]|uniref:hypothetical protein n=1 Tax=Xanthomonas sp. MUS 060 TaxID=1588031 RepID=UPI000B0E833E|nr:hypothetical protein [Xanthomonas sp. MUS 060]
MQARTAQAGRRTASTTGQRTARDRRTATGACQAGAQATVERAAAAQNAAIDDATTAQ